MSEESESLLKFPTPFPIKMMGRDSEEFRATARMLVERHVGPIADEAIKEALSRIIPTATRFDSVRD